LLDSVSVSVMASGLALFCSLLRVFVREHQLLPKFVADLVSATTWQLSKGAGWLPTPERIRLFVYVSVKHVIARVLRLSGGVDDELGLIT
jgi:hypothetical protein